PGNNLPDHSARFIIPKFLVEQLRPARVIVEMPGHQRDVNVPALANGLAIVHRFEHRQQSRMLLHKACQRVQITGARMSARCTPFRRRNLRSLNGSVDVSSSALRDTRQRVSGRRIEGVEIGSRRGFLPLTSDEMSEAALVTIEPGYRLFGVFRGGTVFHADEFFRDAHSVSVLFINSLRHRMAVPRRIPSSHMMLQLTLDVPQKSAGAKAEHLRAQPGIP